MFSLFIIVYYLYVVSLNFSGYKEPGFVHLRPVKKTFAPCRANAFAIAPPFAPSRKQLQLCFQFFHFVFFLMKCFISYKTIVLNKTI